MAVSEPSSNPHRSTVILSIDASKQAREAVNHYLENIHRPENRVILLHVIELPDLAHARQMHLTPSTLYEMWTEEEVNSQELKTQYEEILQAKGVENVQSRCERGLKPGQVIVNVAGEEKASMIVMGTRGMGMVCRTLLGSVSDYVVHHAHCPVIVCRFPDQKK